MKTDSCSLSEKEGRSESEPPDDEKDELHELVCSLQDFGNNHASSAVPGDCCSEALQEWKGVRHPLMHRARIRGPRLHPAHRLRPFFISSLLMSNILY